MSPRIVRNPLTETVLGVFLFVAAGSAAAVAAQEPLELQREYPGSGPYECPASGTPVQPTDDERAQAGQLASEANQAMILGDFERVQVLLERSTELDPVSADLAYRHARVLQDLDRPQAAMEEYCRALDLDVEAIGVTDARLRLNDLVALVRARIPAAARAAFDQGIVEADDSLFTEAIASFTVAVDAAPDWPEPLFNRGVVHEWAGQPQAALADFRRYLLLVAPDETDAILVSQRIGLLEGVASAATPSPAGALALGVIPGMGHYYTSRPLSGTLTLMAAGGLMVGGWAFRNITTLCLEEVAPGSVCPTDLVVDELTERPYLWLGVGLGAAVTIAGAVDAYLAAKRRRGELEAITDPVEGVTVDVGVPTLSVGRRGVDLNFVRVSFR